MDGDLSQALQYIATDYEPWWPESLSETLGWDGKTQNNRPNERKITWGIDRVKAMGVAPFKDIIGCIICNEFF